MGLTKQNVIEMAYSGELRVSNNRTRQEVKLQFRANSLDEIPKNIEEIVNKIKEQKI